MEAKCSSEKSVYNKPARRNFLEGDILHNHRRENLKPYIVHILFTPLVRFNSEPVARINTIMANRNIDRPLFSPYHIKGCASGRD
jgi:hypothetical protein